MDSARAVGDRPLVAPAPKATSEAAGLCRYPLARPRMALNAEASKGAGAFCLSAVLEPKRGSMAASPVFGAAGSCELPAAKVAVPATAGEVSSSALEVKGKGIGTWSPW